MRCLADQFDALLLDLDGTVYLGHLPIEHVTEALAQAAAKGARSVYITNNASRPPAEVAAQLTGMGLIALPDDVLTSPQAASKMLLDRHPPGSAVLVVGAPALADEVAGVGLVPVREASANPVAVVQGHSPDTGWVNLAEACIALRAGADWVAANVDSTLPTDRGLLPGNGAMVAALIAATGLTPRVAGKPARPMIDAAIARTGSTAPLVVGDRLDTDIEAGVTAGVPSLLVFTGVSTAADLLAAPEHQRPNYLAFDLRGLVDCARAIAVADGGSGWTVVSNQDPGDHGFLTLTRDDPPGALPDQDALQALALVTRTAWSTGIRHIIAGDPTSAEVLTRLGLVAP